MIICKTQTCAGCDSAAGMRAMNRHLHDLFRTQENLDGFSIVYEAAGGSSDPQPWGDVVLYAATQAAADRYTAAVQRREAMGRMRMEEIGYIFPD